MGMLIGTRRCLFGGSYSDKLLGYGPIAYWPQGEAGGAVAHCLVNPAQNGAYAGVTLGQPGIGDGNTCPSYNGATSYTNVQTVALTAAFDGAEGTIATWTRVANVGVWTDGALRYLMHLFRGANDYVYFDRTVANNQLQFRYRAGGVDKIVNANALTTVDWFHVALTWSASTLPTGEMRAYLDGTQTGATQVGLGVWAGNLIVSVIGAYNTVPASVWRGWIAHPAVWDRALPAGAIADLATCS